MAEAATALAVLLLSAACFNAQIAVKGETVWTMAGDPIQNRDRSHHNGKIESVGNATAVKIPAGYRVINAKVVTPGLMMLIRLSA